MLGLYWLLPLGLGEAGTVPFPSVTTDFCMAEPEHLSGLDLPCLKHRGYSAEHPGFSASLSLCRAGTTTAAHRDQSSTELGLQGMLGKMVYSHLPCTTCQHSLPVPQRLNPISAAAGMLRDAIHMGQEP